MVEWSKGIRIGRMFDFVIYILFFQKILQFGIKPFYGSVQRFFLVNWMCWVTSVSVLRLRWIVLDSVLPNPLPWWKQSTWSVPNVMRKFKCVCLPLECNCSKFLGYIKWHRNLRESQQLLWLQFFLNIVLLLYY